MRYSQRKLREVRTSICHNTLLYLFHCLWTKVHTRLMYLYNETELPRRKRIQCVIASTTIYLWSSCDSFCKWWWRSGAKRLQTSQWQWRGVYMQAIASPILTDRCAGGRKMSVSVLLPCFFAWVFRSAFRLCRVSCFFLLLAFPVPLLLPLCFYATQIHPLFLGLMLSVPFLLLAFLPRAIHTSRQPLIWATHSQQF